MEAGLVGLVLALVLKRLVMERGLKQLPPEDKARMVDSFSAMRILWVVIIAISVAAFLVLYKSTAVPRVSLTIAYLGVLLACFAAAVVYAWRKLHKEDFPSDFIRAYVVSQIIMLAGLGMLVAAIMTR